MGWDGGVRIIREVMYACNMQESFNPDPIPIPRHSARPFAEAGRDG